MHDICGSSNAGEPRLSAGRLEAVDTFVSVQERCFAALILSYDLFEAFSAAHLYYWLANVKYDSI